MHVVRRLSTTRLLALLTGLLALVVAGTVAASAAVGGSSAPPPKPLLNAVLDSMSGERPAGITARIRFVNNVVPAGALSSEGSPLVTGATGQVWLSLDGRVRAELRSDAGDVQLVADRRGVSVYDASSKTVYRATLPEPAMKDASEAERERGDDPMGAMGAMGPEGVLGEVLGALAGQATISDAEPGTVAGRPAYTVRVSPKHDGGLLGAVEMAFDAERPVPLRLGLYAAGDTEPVLELAATEIAYAPVAESLTRLRVPEGTRVVELPAGLAGGHHGTTAEEEGPRVRAEGEAAVRAALPFPLAAPRTLVGLPRQSVRLMDVDGAPTALVTYGEGLGGLLVLEHAAGDARDDASFAEAFPKVSIDGAEGVEVATALGTLLRFTRDGVTYTLVGTLPAGAAETAARELVSG